MFPAHPAPGSGGSPPASLSLDAQREVTRLCAETAVPLMQYGSESAVIENMTRRLGLALGADRVEVGIFANSIVVATLCDRQSLTTLRRSLDRGIHMQLVTELQRAVLAVEAGALDAAGYRARLEGLVPRHYPRQLVSLAIGLSCASFARLAHADLASCAIVLVASGVAMSVRQLIARLHFSPLVNFFATAFVATSIAGLSQVLHVGATPRTAIAACVLLLVPGFPLINGVSDVVKGYWNTGIARLVYATLLFAASCTGILLALSVLKRWGVS